MSNFVTRVEVGLRCETIISIDDYLSKRQNKLESKERGKPYFDSIERFVYSSLNIEGVSLPKKQYFWNCICFMNLCQRYVSFYNVGNDPKALKPLLERNKDDLTFCREVIEVLDPHIILTTNPSVESALETILLDCGLKKYKETTEIGFGIYSIIPLGKSQWEQDVERMFADFTKDYDSEVGLFVRLNQYIDNPWKAKADGFEGLATLSGKAKNTWRKIVLKYAMLVIHKRFDLKNNLEELMKDYPIFASAAFNFMQYNRTEKSKEMEEEDFRYDRLRRRIRNLCKKDVL